MRFVTRKWIVFLMKVIKIKESIYNTHMHRVITKISTPFPEAKVIPGRKYGISSKNLKIFSIK